MRTTLGPNIEEIYNPADVSINGGITSLIHGQVLTDALSQNADGLIKISIQYYLTDITDNTQYIEEQPMILYHFASHTPAGMIGEIWGRGAYISGGSPVDQNMEVRMTHLRSPGNQETLSFQRNLPR